LCSGSAWSQATTPSKEKSQGKLAVPVRTFIRKTGALLSTYRDHARQSRIRRRRGHQGSRRGTRSSHGVSRLESLREFQDRRRVSNGITSPDLRGTIKKLTSSLPHKRPVPWQPPFRYNDTPLSVIPSVPGFPTSGSHQDHECGSLQREPHEADRSRNSQQEIRGSRGTCGAPFGHPQPTSRSQRQNPKNIFAIREWKCAQSGSKTRDHPKYGPLHPPRPAAIPAFAGQKGSPRLRRPGAGAAPRHPSAAPGPQATA
jgi:hypothetical protein